MKTMILATAAVLALGIGSAFAGDGEGPAANTTFTQLPGVIAQAQVGRLRPHMPTTRRPASRPLRS